ncbi:MAG: CPBP family intramembrane metalloprotease [Bacteroidetes bacterium]|nr:MAG: CPBP family intramembrane metalloprotease [Bacteroidota bacterium]
MTDLSLIDHLLFVLFCLIIPLGSMARTPHSIQEVEWTPEMKVALYRSNAIMLWVVAGILVGAWLLQGRSLAWMGFQLPLSEKMPQALLIALSFVLLYAVDSWRQLGTPQARARTRARWQSMTPFVPASWREFRAFIPLALAAGICEEIWFRGFCITYLVHLFGLDGPAEAVLVVALPALIFALSHSYQGGEAMFKIGVLSFFFGVLFLTTRSLVWPIILHIAVDLASGLLSVKYYYSTSK